MDMFAGKPWETSSKVYQPTEPPLRRAAMAATDFITTTENALPDHEIVARYGVVRGITVRSRSALGRLVAKFQLFLGDAIALVTDLCEQARAEAFSIAIDHAKPLGA